MIRGAFYGLRMVAVGLLIFCVGAVAVAQQQLDENCTVSVLNRTVRVNHDGSWVLPNVPANFGQVKARATCVRGGVTTFGESEFFTIPANGVINLPAITLGSATQIPASLVITPGTLSYTTAGQTTQLSVIAKYPDNSTRDVTSPGAGTNYTTSNPAIATVSASGLVTAISSGTAVLQATNDGASAILTATVLVSGADSDGDGIPDDAEVRMGLDPNNPVDAQEDFDRDGLTNLREFQLGTDIRNADTDRDGLSDGDEVNNRHTNPLLADTDGDLIPDGVEVQTNTDPLDRNSYDLRRAAATSVVKPPSFVLTTSALFPVASQQLTWTVTLIDGKTTLDLTADPRTNYATSDPTICNFGPQKGLVFAGNPGSCTITISNNTLSATAVATVQSFTPQPLSFVDIPGFANNVDVSGSFAYVAAGSTGLQVVDVSDRVHPRVVASRSLPGNANDVRVAGNFAYVAAGSAGLQIVDVSNPLNPVVTGSLNTGNVAWDVMVKGSLVYIANGTGGLVIADASSPSAPTRLGSVTLPGTSKGVDVDTIRQIAVVALGGNGIAVVNVASPASPAMLSNLTGGDVRDVAVSGNFAFLADFTRSFTSVDLTNPSAPQLRASTPQNLGGLLQDVVVNGSIAAGADVFFVNGVPMIDVSSPASPQPRLILDFRTFRDDNGTGIAMDQSFVYLTAESGTISENGVNGNTRLYIGQYRNIQDNARIPPSVQITSPASGSQVIQGSSVTVTASATDDVAVAAVTFFVDGQSVFTANSAPYQFTFTAPSSGSSLTLGASAVDFGGNVGDATNVLVNLIPDPLTTVVGRVIDASNNPVAGATVSAFTVSTVTAPDGTFSLPGVSTIQGNIVASARITIADGTSLVGKSAAVPPVRGGTTNVGDIVVRPEAKFAVVALSNSTASIIDLSANTVVTTVPTGSQPLGASITPDGRKGFVANFSSATLTVIDLTASPPVAAGTIGTSPIGAPESIAITPDGRFGIVADGGGTRSVISIDLDQRRIVNTLPVPGNQGAAITPDGTMALVLSADSNQVAVLTIGPDGMLADTTQRVSLSGVAGGPRSIVITPNGHRALVTDTSRNLVTILGIANGTVTNIGSIPIGISSTSGIAVTPDGRKIYVSGFGNVLGVLSVDANDNITDTTVRIFIPNGTPNTFFGVPGLAVTPDGTRLYISGASSGKISVLDTSTDSLLPVVITVGGSPAGIGMPVRR